MSHFRRQRAVHDEADAPEPEKTSREAALDDDEDEDEFAGAEEDPEAVARYAVKQEEQDPAARPPDVVPYHFCPSCGNLLLLGASAGFEFACATCSYRRSIQRPQQHSQYFQARDTVGIISERDKNRNRQKTNYICPKCEHPEAYFFMLQTRSADEPMTTFYTCANDKCGLKSRE